MAHDRSVGSKTSVAFFSPVSFFKGGAERSLFDLMENPSVRPILIVPEEGPLTQEAEKRGVESYVLPLGNVSSIRRPLKPAMVFRATLDWARASVRLAQLVRSHGIDIVHTNGLKAHAVACLSARIGGAPCVPHIRDIAHNKIERVIWQGLARLSARTILVSRACWPSNQLPSKVSVIFNSVPHCDHQIPRPASLQGRVIIGVCGRIHPYKGVHLALDWVADARSHDLDIQLVVRGEAAPEDAPYLHELQSKLVALDLCGRVSFEGQKEGLSAIYGGLDAVLVPSSTPDPLPRSVMEALALGLPVIGYPAGGIVEMIEPGRNGWLASSSDEFCSAVADVAALGPEGLADLRARTADTVINKFGRARMFSRLDSVYDQVMEATNGRTVRVRVSRIAGRAAPRTEE